MSCWGVGVVEEIRRIKAAFRDAYNFLELYAKQIDAGGNDAFWDCVANDYAEICRKHNDPLATALMIAAFEEVERLWHKRA